ncbi:hypothetical protein SAMD00023353_1600820 [Rosellinia necatrix]|uniref:Uncharacterized protein n=1 Tax=Rosellinia necatrix TaxID=77044 RepID=A0A1S8A7H7_ROSNE|nr:hypothetical protein SAMD00023353_1600820 [Rosellinia necatrix]
MLCTQTPNPGVVRSQVLGDSTTRRDRFAYRGKQRISNLSLLQTNAVQAVRDAAEDTRRWGGRLTLKPR